MPGIQDTAADMHDTSEREVVISMRGVRTVFGSRVIHDGVDLDVYRGEVLALVGGSGSGKTTLMREMIMLHVPDAGSVKLFGKELVGVRDADANALRRRLGVLFQQGALFSGLTVLQNVGLPLREHTRLDDRMIDTLARVKIAQAGLKPEAAMLFPSELSGGMIKRAALARALALDPEILFLDEPTAGLDPVISAEIEELILRINHSMGTTMVIITHSLNIIFKVAHRIIMLDKSAQGVIAQGDPKNLKEKSPNPVVKQFFNRQANLSGRTIWRP